MSEGTPEEAPSTLSEPGENMHPRPRKPGPEISGITIVAHNLLSASEYFVMKYHRAHIDVIKA